MGALLGLLGAVVGGVLVMAGDIANQRRQHRQEAHRLAWEIASELIGRQRKSRSQALESRRQGRFELTEADLQALRLGDPVLETRFYMLPMPERLRESLRGANEAFGQLVDSALVGEDEWDAAALRHKQAVYEFEAQMRQLQGARRPEKRVTG
jgi:hypothetical protein